MTLIRPQYKLKNGVRLKRDIALEILQMYQGRTITPNELKVWFEYKYKQAAPSRMTIRKYIKAAGGVALQRGVYIVPRQQELELESHRPWLPIAKVYKTG